MKKVTIVIICVLVLGLIFKLWAQEKLHGVEQVKRAIDVKQYTVAEQMLNEDIAYWIDNKKYDSTTNYIQLKGTLLLQKNSDLKIAGKKLESFVDSLYMEGFSNKTHYDQINNISKFYEQNSNTAEAYSSELKALTYAKKAESDQAYYEATCEYNLGVYAFRMGKAILASQHHRNGVKIRKDIKNIEPEQLYFSYNALSNIYWFEMQYDSTLYYANAALEMLEKAPPNALNRYYRKALINNLIMGVLKEQGKSSEAIKLAYEIIADLEIFIGSEGFEDKKLGAKETLYAVIDNLSGAYIETGNFRKAEQIALYSYEQKKLKFGAKHESVYTSDIILGQYYGKANKLDEAERRLKIALNGLQNKDGDFTFWQADAQYALALVYEQQNKILVAQKAYDTAGKLYDIAYAGTYDDIYADFVRAKAKFLARNNSFEEALVTIQKLKVYLNTIGDNNALQSFYYNLALAEINTYAKQFQAAIKNSESALQSLDALYTKSSTGLDSVKIQFFQPKVIYLKSNAQYQIVKNKDSAFLLQLYQDLDTALSILERRQAINDDPVSNGLMMEEYKQLMNFLAKITFDLSKAGSNVQYLEQFINLKEGSVYGKIRGTLNKDRAIQFSNIPKSVLDEEEAIKKSLNSLTSQNRNKSNTFQDYQKAVEKRSEFLERLKAEYPQYYELRYATLLHDLPEIKKLVPNGSTLVRYYMIDTQMCVLVSNGLEHHLVSLPIQALKEKIDTLLDRKSSESSQLKMMHELYNQLWAPIAQWVKTRNVIIIPDGLLYTINIEMLSARQLQHFSQMKDESLIAKHIFSYHYSLWMLHQGEPKKDKEFRNYIAFVPGFSDQMKQAYERSVGNSMGLDKAYLKLLPQPQSKVLADDLSQKLNGKSITEEASTAKAFRNKAANHKIVHLATHAEYNNSIPEQSGLYFAKQKSEENFVNLSEVYAIKISCDLLILTACESGKPGYEDGEGLVSLSHAFNYAGSQNILTAIWKIDENTSAQITEYFVDALQQGLATDEALRAAKLKYLQQAEGRLLAPAYWSGLILMGEPIVLQLENSFLSQNWWWLLLLLLGVVGIAFFYFKKKNKFYVRKH